MTRIRLFLAALFASFGLLAAVAAPAADAAEGELVHVCVTVRALAFSQCVDI